MQKDTVTIARIALLHPKLRAEASQIYDEICQALVGAATCRFAFTLRTFAEQDALYAQGRTRPGNKVTNAKGGQSYHNYGLAIDIVLIIGGKTASWDMIKDFDNDHTPDWMEVVKIFKAHGWEWGGDWKSLKDYPHFQKTFGKTEAQLLALHTAKNVDGEGYVVI